VRIAAAGIPAILCDLADAVVSADKLDPAVLAEVLPGADAGLQGDWIFAEELVQRPVG
jgi:hypothetical protein